MASAFGTNHNMTCEGCGLGYDEMRTGMSFIEVRRMIISIGLVHEEEQGQARPPARRTRVLAPAEDDALGPARRRLRAVMTSREMWIAIAFWTWILDQPTGDNDWILGEVKSLFDPGRAPRTVYA